MQQLQADCAARPRCRTIMLAKQQKQEAGRAMFSLNQRALSRGPDHKAVKGCFDQAARQTFPGGHATVQSQGSVSKGTGVQGRSDWDFIVRLTAAVPTVTQAQRMQFLAAAVDCMRAQGISYRCQPGENRIKFYQGSCQGVALPDIDVVFERFKGVPKAPPNNRAMAACPNGQAVVRCIKDLPTKYTNLVEPKSMFLEDLVRRVEQQVKKEARLPGAVGFPTLLQASLKAIATQQHKKVLTSAKLDNDDWGHVANKVLNKQQTTGAWM